MNWKQRFRKLPVILPLPRVFTDKEGIEAEYHGAKCMVTHNYVPGVGAHFIVSISGPTSARERLVEELEEQLGEPLSVDNRPDLHAWFYTWPSKSTDIPETRVHKVLGRERIAQLCNQSGLTTEESTIIHDLLAAYTYFMQTGDLQGRVRFTQMRLGSLPQERAAAVMQTFLTINQEFARRNRSR